MFDRKKSLQSDKRTNIVTEKAKTIHPLYTSYGGGGGGGVLIYFTGKREFTIASSLPMAIIRLIHWQ